MIELMLLCLVKRPTGFKATTGQMEVKSEPGAATEVTLSVPLKDASLPD
jgi:hypothetical protein